MPEPRFQKAYEDAAMWYGQGYKLGYIEAQLQQRDPSPSRDTIKAWIKQFRKNQEDSVDWHHFEKSTGLPTEALPAALEAWADAWWPPRFTVREARWAWRVRQAAPTAPHYVVSYAAKIMAVRERVRSLGMNVQINDGSDRDVWAFLASREWESREKADHYQQAITEGLVPRLYEEPLKELRAKGAKEEADDDPEDRDEGAQS